MFKVIIGFIIWGWILWAGFFFVFADNAEQRVKKATLEHFIKSYSDEEMASRFISYLDSLNVFKLDTSLEKSIKNLGGTNISVTSETIMPQTKLVTIAFNYQGAYLEFSHVVLEKSFIRRDPTPLSAMIYPNALSCTINNRKATTVLSELNQDDLFATLSSFFVKSEKHFIETLPKFCTSQQETKELVLNHIEKTNYPEEFVNVPRTEQENNQPIIEQDNYPNYQEQENTPLANKE